MCSDQKCREWLSLVLCVVPIMLLVYGSGTQQIAFHNILWKRNWTWACSLIIFLLLGSLCIVYKIIFSVCISHVVVCFDFIDFCWIWFSFCCLILVLMNVLFIFFHSFSVVPPPPWLFWWAINDKSYFNSIIDFVCKR